MIEGSLLGKTTQYIQTYTPDLLYPVPRQLARDKTGIPENLPFDGTDLWTGYELSWLGTKGKPELALIELHFPCTSPNIVESKSLKLYLNSFNQSQFDSFDIVKNLIQSDLEKVIQAPVHVRLIPFSSIKSISTEEFSGICLDDLDIGINTYDIHSAFLKTHSEPAQETLYSNLLKSNCMATGQPDWGSV